MFALLLALICLALPPTTAVAAPAETKPSLSEVRERIHSLSTEIERDQSKRDSAAESLQDSEKAVASAKAKLRKLERQMREQQQKIDATEHEADTARQSLDTARQQLAAQLRAAYMAGVGGSRGEFLLSIDNTAEVGRLLVYHDYWQRAQVQLLNEVQSRFDALTNVLDTLKKQKDEYAGLAEEQRGALSHLHQTHRERSQQLKKLQTQLKTDKHALEKAKADEKALQRLFRDLQKSFSELPPSQQLFYDKPFKSLKGRLPWPVRGKLIARYGAPKSGGTLKWNGDWIAASENSDIRAVARGRVAYVGWMHRYGLIVLLEHEGGYYSLYGHAASATVMLGKEVKAGDIIATVGNSGGHELYGAYFELRKGAQPIDPSQWLAH